MKAALTFLILILAAEAIVWFQMRRLINSWEKEDVLYVEVRLKLMGILGAAALVIFLLRLVILDLLPLLRG